MDQELDSAVKRQGSMNIRSMAAPTPQTRPILTPEYEYGQLRLQATSLCNAPSWVAVSGKPSVSWTGEEEFPSGCAFEARRFLCSSQADRSRCQQSPRSGTAV